MTKNTTENRVKLSRDMIDAWDMDTLVEYAVGAIEENLANCDDEEFDGEWKQFYVLEDDVSKELEV